MSKVTLIDLVPRLDTEEFRDVFLFIVFRPTTEKVQRLIEGYRSDPHLKILGVERAERLVALIGLDLNTPHEGVIRHIVVNPDHRHIGLGRAMIAAACDQFGLQVLTAETDRDADGFYRRCGFEVQSLGELYPGTERFCCVLRKRDNRAQPPHA